MLHGLTVFLGIVMWMFILLALVPKAYRFAMTHKDSIVEGARTLKRVFGK